MATSNIAPLSSPIVDHRPAQKDAAVAHTQPTPPPLADEPVRVSVPRTRAAAETTTAGDPATLVERIRSSPEAASAHAGLSADRVADLLKDD